MKFLYELFGMLMKNLYNLCGNYGLSIILFAIIAKLITAPFTIKQYRSMQVMHILQPAQEIIQKKYAKDPTKQNAELNKLYKKYNYSPLSGCLPLLIQFPIIIGLWGALREPTTYVFTVEEFAAIGKSFLWINDMMKSPIDLFKSVKFAPEFFLSLILPIISIVLTIVQQKQTSKSNTSAQNDQMKFMTNFMTIFIAYISFQFNQGIALYWSLQTGLGLLQNWIMDKCFPVKIEPPKIVKKGAVR